MSIQDLINTAAQMENQSEAKAGGEYERRLIPAGKTVSRFIEYIELGKHVEMYEGKPKPPAEMVRVTFELLNPKTNLFEIEVEGGTRKLADRISITMPKKQTEKAKFFKLFKAMQRGRDQIVHMAQMLNEVFFVDVKHNTKDNKTYANIYADGQWYVSAPIVEDPLAGTSMNISDKVIPAISPLKIFLWGNPTKETWDSLFIDGEREVKNADGTTRKESKNWLQETILSATDFGGSALEQMLAGVDNLPTSEPAKNETGAQTSQGASNAEAHANQQVKTAATLPAEGAAAGTQTSATATQNSAADALAALGLG